LASIGTSSGRFSLVNNDSKAGAIEPAHELVAQRQGKKALTRRGHPWRPDRPAVAGLSMRRDSCRSVPSTYSPPASTDDFGGLPSLASSFDLRQFLVPGRFVLFRRLHRIQALGAQPLVGEEVDVAAQHDLFGYPRPAHVGGHGVIPPRRPATAMMPASCS